MIVIVAQFLDIAWHYGQCQLVRHRDWFVGIAKSFVGGVAALGTTRARFTLSIHRQTDNIREGIVAHQVQVRIAILRPLADSASDLVRLIRGHHGKVEDHGAEGL